MLDWMIADGRVALLAMAVLAAELVAIRLAGLGSPAFVANAVSGLGLMGALYCALAGLAPVAILACLGVGLLAHLAYLARTWRDRDGAGLSRPTRRVP